MFYAVTMRIFQMKIIISSEKWFSLVVTFFFLKIPKIWVGRITLNGEKKRMAFFVSKCKHALKVWCNQQVKPSLYHVISVFIFSFIQFIFRFYGFLQPTVLFDRIGRGSSMDTVLIY